MSSTTMRTLNGIGGNGTREAFAVGSGGAILHGTR
jgi:hypothetical protein